jgi:hypothetical protein
MIGALYENPRKPALAAGTRSLQRRTGYSHAWRWAIKIRDATACGASEVCPRCHEVLIAGRSVDFRRSAASRTSSASVRTACGRAPVLTEGCFGEAKRESGGAERLTALEKPDGLVWVGSATSLIQSAEVRAI